MNRTLWVAARRLTSAFASGSGDNFVAIASEIDAVDGWKVVALALNGDVASLAHEVHGDEAQHWLDHRVVRMLDRSAEEEEAS
jgi:hypothetical protein